MKSRSARTIRCFTEQELSVHSELILNKRVSHHLSTVLRAKTGSEVTLFNGDGMNYSAVLTNIGKQATAQIEYAEQGHTESPLYIQLVQCISRGDRMDTTVQKATELGVNHIQPVYSTHSISKLDESRAQKKQEHWLNIAISACEQSGRCVVPSITEPLSLLDFLSTMPSCNTGESRFVFTPTAQHSLPKAGEINRVTLLIGPETGLDQNEIATCIQAGFNAMQLGPRVLRTETAGPTTIAIMQSLYGDLHSRQ